MCSAADRDLSADKRAPSGERPRRVVLQSVFIVCRPVPLRLRALPCDETHARVGRRTATQQDRQKSRRQHSGRLRGRHQYCQRNHYAW